MPIMRYITNCSVCNVELGKANHTGRCRKHGRYSEARAALPPKIWAKRNKPETVKRVRVRPPRTRVFLTDWCPPDLIDDARALMKCVSMAEARRIIEADLAARERKRRAAMTPFERQMDAIRRGVGLVGKVDTSRAYDVTLGGVSSI